MYPKNFLANVIPTGLFSAALNVFEIYPTYIQDINRKEIKEILKLSNLKKFLIYQTEILNYLNKCFFGYLKIFYRRLKYSPPFTKTGSPLKTAFEFFIMAFNFGF